MIHCRLYCLNRNMKILCAAYLVVAASAFSIQSRSTRRSAQQVPLFVSIGLGPEEQAEQKELVAGEDYEIPNHEEYRTSRRSKLDEQCDAWFESLLGSSQGILGSIAEEQRKVLLTPVPLVNDLEKPFEDPEWTPYVTTKLPWTPLTPAYGLEQFGLPTPRRNAETWRHFDVAGLVSQDYSSSTSPLEALDDAKVAEYREKLQTAGGWLDDAECAGRLVYINGNFCPELSMTSDMVQNLDDVSSVSEEVQTCLARLTDGFTDELAAPVPNNEIQETSFKKLSRPNHNLGEPTTQFAINTQQGTACFAALNTIKAQGVAYVHVPKAKEVAKPVLVVNAVTKSGGSDVGVSFHPRALVIAESQSRLSFVQSCVDLDDGSTFSPKLYNGYTQVFVKADANVTHSYLEETGGLVTPGVEQVDEECAEGQPKAREVEASRDELKDTHLEAIDVQVMGEKGAYEGTMISMGGSGRVRMGLSVTLLKPEAHATVNGFALSGGAQRTDMKTNIHHVAQGTTSEQLQKNMIGGRATGAFRGRIRVEQSAQQTDSQQLSRTVLLTDKARAWAVPSLEIIADDVQCTHGATISDLSEEELFYLRSRGMDQTMARNMLMFAFSGDVAQCVDPAVLGALDGNVGLRRRIIDRLENLVPQGERAVKSEFQSI